MIDQIGLLRFWYDELAKPRNQEPKRLLRHGRKAYSQNDEDGIIAEIFSRIGTENKTFVEFGVELGGECNTLWPLYNGWKGLWIEGNPAYVTNIQKTHKHWIEAGRLCLAQSFITAGNINSLIGDNFHYPGCDLLSIDIDRNDYWIWQAIDVIQPRVVVIEYNATWFPPSSIVVKYDESAVWDSSNYFGSSLEALRILGRAKGYHLVGCNFSGINAFFVRENLCGSHFILSHSAEEHYEPPRYIFSDMKMQHQAGVGPVLSVSDKTDLVDV